MQARAIKTKQAILTAAREEFSDKGLAGTRVDVIAEKAGVNKQRIYAYFKSKENLFAEVLRLSFEGLTKEEEECFLKLSESDIPRMAEIILRRYMSLHQKHPHFWRLLAWENLSGGHHIQVLEGIKNPIYQHLGQLYQRGQGMGTFKKDVSFTTFMYTLQAISAFRFSNQLTLSKSLGLPPSAQGSELITTESIKLLS
jgi:AcrR family transcriptional regulator